MMKGALSHPKAPLVTVLIADVIRGTTGMLHGVDVNTAGSMIASGVIFLLLLRMAEIFGGISLMMLA